MNRRATDLRALLRLALVLGAAFAALAPRGVEAQGFGVYEHGACVMGLADAAVASPCEDGSALYYNPAALAGSEGTRASAGLTGILLDGEFTADGTGETTEMDTSWEPVPYAYASHAITDRWTAGLGAFVPYGLSTRWPLDFEGRFVGYDNTLRTFFVQPTVAYQVTDRLQLGGGPTFAFGSVELNRRLDLARQPAPPSAGAPAGTTLGDLGVPSGTDFADARLDADAGTTVGVNLGIRYRVGERVTLGARYLSEVEMEYDGSAGFEPVSTGIQLPEGNPFGVPAGTSLDQVVQSLGLFSEQGPLADQGVKTSITMPAQFQGGAAVRLRPDVTVFADYHWIGWAAFDRIRLDFESEATPDDVLVQNYQDTNTFRLATEYRPTSGLALRGGYATADAAAPPETVTPLLPDAARDIYSASVGWSGESGLALNGGFLFLDVAERRGRVRNAPTGQQPTTDLNSGTYSMNIFVVGANASYRF